MSISKGERSARRTLRSSGTGASVASLKKLSCKMTCKLRAEPSVSRFESHQSTCCSLIRNPSPA